MLIVPTPEPFSTLLAYHLNNSSIRYDRIALSPLPKLSSRKGYKPSAYVADVLMFLDMQGLLDPIFLIG